MNTKTTEFLQSYKKDNPDVNDELLTKALTFASAHPEKLPFAENALTQGIEMAKALVELKCDSQTIACALIYPTLFYYPFTPESVCKQFGKTIYKLFCGAKNMDAIAIHETRHPDNLRKMLLSMVDDIRVVLIKLAECVTIMHHLKYCKPVVQKQVASQTLNLYAPLANRLGIGQLKWQLEDLAFRYLQPEQYQHISKKLNMRRVERDQFIAEMLKQLNTLFNESQIEKFSISGRAKHIYSIAKKLKRKDGDFTEIYDTSAFRVLVPTIKDCYTALSLVHATWNHIAKEFDDYIAKPKANGYRSIHTAVIGPNDINVEVQIRTYEMHEESELGVAAHWKYKEGRSAQSDYEDKIALLREMMDWQKEVSQEDDANLIQQIFKDRIYVFSPLGDIYDLPKGATPLDFAYYIHTDVGHLCKGAKVNGKLIPLTTPLKTGDQVQIMTAKQGQPSRDWLNKDQGYLHTSSAQNKVRHYFSKIDRQQNLSNGVMLWEKSHHKTGLTRADLQKVLKRFNYKSLDDLFIAIGSGHVSVANIVHQLKESQSATKTSMDEVNKLNLPKQEKSSTTALDVHGVGDLLTQIAKCCKPIPGDEILGYITKNSGISIHQKNCRNIQHSLRLRPEKILEVDWGSEESSSYSVDLHIDAQDRNGLIRDISGTIINFDVKLLGLNSRMDKSKDIAHINITIEISSNAILDKIRHALRSIPGVVSVARH